MENEDLADLYRDMLRSFPQIEEKDNSLSYLRRISAWAKRVDEVLTPEASMTVDWSRNGKYVDVTFSDGRTIKLTSDEAWRMGVLFNSEMTQRGI